MSIQPSFLSGSLQLEKPGVQEPLGSATHQTLTVEAGEERDAIAGRHVSWKIGVRRVPKLASRMGVEAVAPSPFTFTVAASRLQR